MPWEHNRVDSRLNSMVPPITPMSDGFGDSTFNTHTVQFSNDDDANDEDNNEWNDGDEE